MKGYYRILQIVLILIFHIITTSAQSFRSAAVKKNITPDNSQQLLGYGARKSTGVYDSIYHRILVLNDGENEFYLVSSDICLVSPSEYDRVQDMITDEFGIEGEQFWWSVTHTHSAPEVGPPGLPEVFLGNRYEHQFDTAYTNFVVGQLLAGIHEARMKLKPSKLGVGWGFSRANINRRARDVDGVTRLGMNPDGSVDRRIGILKIVERDTDAPIALISNYAIHGTVMSGANLLISGDVQGVVSEYVEEQIGAPMLFINGAAGNIAPLYSVYPSPEAGHLYEFKQILGKRILDAQALITPDRESINLQFGKLIMRTPRKEDLSWSDDLKAYSEPTAGGKNLILLPIHFLKIDNDIGIWAAPLELFCEISNDIRDRSPFPYTFYYGYTNGWLGYMLTEEEVGYGGYEPMVSPYTPEAGEQLVETVSGYLEGELLSK